MAKATTTKEKKPDTPPAATQEPSEVDVLRSQLAERDAQIAELSAEAPPEPPPEPGVLVNHKKTKDGKHPYDFEVQQLGRDGKGGDHPLVLVKGSCDESEAIRAYCKSIGLAPSKHRFRATKAA